MKKRKKWKGERVYADDVWMGWEVGTRFDG